MPAKSYDQTHICDQKCLHDEVMKHIYNDHVKMKPKVYFVLGSILLGAGMAGAVITSIFFTHLTLYRLRYDGVFEYFDVGREGMRTLMLVFPWIPFLIAVGGLIGGSYLLREYEVAYKHRSTRLLLAFTALLLTLGYLLDQSGAQRHIVRMRPLYGLYQPHERRPFVYGKIHHIDGHRAYIQTPYNQLVTIELQSASSSSSLRPGSSIQARGTWRGEVFVIETILMR